MQPGTLFVRSRRVRRGCWQCAWLTCEPFAVSTLDPETDKETPRLLPTYNQDPGIHCEAPGCGAVNPITARWEHGQRELFEPKHVRSEVLDLFDLHFAGEPVHCFRCDSPLDLWERCLSAIDFAHAFEFGQALVGASRTMFDLQIKGDEVTRIDLRDRGIPDAAKILSVRYTSGCWQSRGRSPASVAVPR